MEPTFMVLGVDGNQYGPVTAEQLRAWKREGRVAADTQVQRSDQTTWAQASAFPELATDAAPEPAHVDVLPVAGASPEADAAVKAGASWFYWIAGFSIVNTILVMSGSSWGFAIGLGITSLLDVVASRASGAASAVAIALNIAATGVLVLLGFFAGKRHGWAFIVGMILLALDTVLTGLGEMWISLAIHVFALFAIFKGFQALRASR